MSALRYCGNLEFTAVDDEILNGIATILWATAWADHVEECGCQSISGCEITDVMPPLPSAATDLAYKLASLVVDKHGMTLAEMYAKALEEDAIEGIAAPSAKSSATRFGDCIAHEAMGSGVSWADYHATDALSHYIHIDCEVFDLQELATSQCGCMNLVVHVGSRDEYTDEEGNTFSEWAPGRHGTVMLDVYAKDYRHAEAWADRYQSIDGSSWETGRDLDGLVYTLTYDRPGLIADLRAEGYTLDLSEYTPSPECE